MSEVLEKMLNNDTQLAFYMSNKLLNLSQFAVYVKPLIESQIHKEVQTPSIIMALSRLQKKTIQKFDKPKFKVSGISMHTDLCTMSFNKSPSTHLKIQQLHNSANSENIYFMLSESTFEVTFITKKDFIENKETPIPKYEHLNLSAIAVQFDPKYLSIPGVMTAVMQKLSLQNINFIEMTSTCTEMIFYIDHNDLRLAFDTIHDSFFV
jgi:aspartokinase